MRYTIQMTVSSADNCDKTRAIKAICGMFGLGRHEAKDLVEEVQASRSIDKIFDPTVSYNQYVDDFENAGFDITAWQDDSWEILLATTKTLAGQALDHDRFDIVRDLIDICEKLKP